MRRTIQLMFDWSLHPFYVQAGPSPLFQLMFGFPARVAEALVAWSSIRSTSTGTTQPSTRLPSKAALDQYVEHCRVAARCLRAHLPDDVSIEYLADGILASEYY